MAELTAKAAGGNFMSASTWEPEQVPTSADDLFLKATSGNVTVNVEGLCRSLNCTGYVGKLTINAAQRILMGDGTAGASNIALKLVTGMTLTLGSETTSEFRFVSTNPTVQTIDFAGKTTGNVQWAGNPGSYKYEGTHKTGAACVLTVERGTLDTNGKACEWGQVVLSGSISRTLKLGSSVITLIFSGTTVWSNGIITNLTFEPGTSKIVCTGAAKTFSAGNVSYYEVEVTGSGEWLFQGAATFTNFKRVGTASRTEILNINGSPTTVTGLLTLEGNSEANRMLIKSSVGGTAKSLICNGTTSLKWVEFTDIAVTGTAAPISGTLIGNAMGNSGITFTVAATQTYVGGTKKWSEASAWTSRVPLPQDDVVVATTGGGILSLDMSAVGRNLTFTGYVGTLKLEMLHRIFGNYTLATGVTLTTTASTNNPTFAGREFHTIKTAGREFATSMAVNSFGGTYKLEDDLVLTGSRTFSVNNSPTFDANGKNVTAPAISLGAGATTPTVKMGSGTWKCSAVTAWTTSATTTLEAETSTIEIIVASATTRVFAGGGKTYNTFKYTLAGSTGSLEITGANTFATFEFSDASNARTLIFPASTVTTITSKFNVVGTSGKLMNLRSSIEGTQFTLTRPTGVTEADYLSIKDSKATGPGRWLAGAHSENVSNNTGWEFNVTPEVKKGGATGSGAGSASAIVVRRKRAKENSASASGSVTVKIKRRLRTGATGSGTGTATSTGTMRIAVGGGHGSANSFVSDVSVRRRFGRAQGSGTGSASGKQTAIFVGSAEGDGSALGLSIGVQRRRRGGASGEAEGSADSGDAFRLRSPGESRAQGESSVNGEGNLIAVGGGVAQGISEAVLALLQDHLPGRGVLDHQPTGSAELEHDTSVATIEREP